MDLLKKLQEKFPDHKITTQTIVSPDDFVPYKVFYVDGKQLTRKWNIELEQDLVWQQLEKVEDLILNTFASEISAILYE